MHQLHATLHYRIPIMEQKHFGSKLNHHLRATQAAWEHTNPKLDKFWLTLSKVGTSYTGGSLLWPPLDGVIYGSLSAYRALIQIYILGSRTEMYLM